MKNSRIYSLKEDSYDEPLNLEEKLISKGIIIRVGSKKDGYWKIKD
jgi:hypothetical protein